MLCLQLRQIGFDGSDVVFVNGVSNIRKGAAENSAPYRLHLGVHGANRVFFDLSHKCRPARRQSLRRIFDEVLSNPGTIQVSRATGKKTNNSTEGHTGGAAQQTDKGSQRGPDQGPGWPGGMTFLDHRCAIGISHHHCVCENSDATAEIQLHQCCQPLLSFAQVIKNRYQHSVHDDLLCLLQRLVDGFGQSSVKGFDIGIELLLKLLYGMPGCSLQGLLQPRPADDD